MAQIGSSASYSHRTQGVSRRKEKTKVCVILLDVTNVKYLRKFLGHQVALLWQVLGGWHNLSIVG